jgi:hypothetical protein
MTNGHTGACCGRQRPVAWHSEEAGVAANAADCAGSFQGPRLRRRSGFGAQPGACGRREHPTTRLGPGSAGPAGALAGPELALAADVRSPSCPAFRFSSPAPPAAAAAIQRILDRAAGSQDPGNLGISGPSEVGVQLERVQLALEPSHGAGLLVLAHAAGWFFGGGRDGAGSGDRGLGLG